METGKPGLVSAPVHINSVAAQTEKRMDIQAPLMAVYIPTVPTLPAQPPAAAQEPTTLHLAVPPLYSKDTLPFLTLHIAGGLQSQQGLSLAAASPAARPKSTGKHVCPHCGRDCMKPSVLEKHLRCHTGERPYPCTTCGISFKTQSNLYKHKRTQAHARLSSESDQSCQGSLDSMSSSRETCTSSMSLDEHSEESGSLERDATLPAAEIICRHNTARVCAVNKHGSVSEQNEPIPADHKRKEQNESAKVTKDGDKPPLAASRHLPLQRQEAMLFSKQWESSVTRGKSQSHESTDSGFSESSDHYPSPSSALPDHSMDSLTESMKERLEETINTTEVGQGGQEPKGTVREQEQKMLEERISKLISENTAVVEDKQLENVRPRKTVLSKQGSIDLPMPYTYKDSFHFDMRISKTPSVGLQRHRNPGLYSSVPTQQSTTMEHAPLTRSNSLPFSVTLLQPERSSPTPSCQNDYVTLIRRGSSGQINPAGFAIKPVNQQSSTHRPLVRQTAVDCNHATDGLYMNSSVEEASTCSQSCDGDSTDICGEASNRKFRRKKTQKFAYNKWYMYGGGTFKKLYSAEKGGDDSVNKGRKYSTNPEHEAVQGLQKQLSEVHKETAATTASTVNFTSSSAIACDPDCSPAKLSFVSALDFNLKTNQLHPSCSSLKSPLRRNLSLSILPVPLIGTLVGHRTESRADNRRVINEQKHTDSSSQLCGSQIPSDRKKQKTDDQVICPLETEADPNRLTHPPISVTSSASLQATNISCTNPQKSLKHTQLKGHLFPPCIINAKPPSVSTSLATSTPSVTKTSFLPKYQLKLPNATEPDSNPSLHVVDKLSGTDGHSFTSALSSSYTEQTQISKLTSCDSQKKAAIHCTQSQPLFTCTASTLSPAETLNVNKSVTSSRDEVHRQFAAATITTTCRQDYQAGLCSASVEPAPMHLPGITATMVVNFPPAPTITTANNQKVNQTSFSQPYPGPPLPHTQISPTSDQPSSVNRAYASSNTPIIPCQIVPFDQMQTNSQNVFHVHTADLQICLQIISDEQLALIEPQIERQAGSTVLQRPDVEVVAPLMQRKAQSSDTMKSSNKGKDHQQPGHQKELDKSESLTTLNVERIKPSLSVQVGKVESNPPLTEPSNSSQAAVSAESKTPEALSLSQLPHKYGHVSMDSEGHIMSTATSLKGVKSGNGQTSEEEHTLCLKRCAEEQLLPDRSVSQSGLGSTVFGQNNLSTTSLSSGTVNQNSTRRDTLGNESQHKLKNQGAPCNVGATTARGEAFTYRSGKLEGGETNPPLQIELGQAYAAACAEELSVTVPSYFINKYNAPGQLEPQASMYCSNPMESALSETLNSSSHAKIKCHMLSPMDNSFLTQEMTLGESQDVSAPSEKQMDQFTSVYPHIQVGRRKDTPAVPRSTHSPTAGCATQKELQTQQHGRTPDQPDSTDWGPKQSQEDGETNCEGVEGQDGGGTAGERKDMGLKADEQTGQWETESNCRCTGLQSMTKPEGEDREAKTESINNSQLLEQHLHYFSHTHSGMSSYSQHSPQQTPGTSDNCNLPSDSSQTSLLNSPQPLSEPNNSCFSHPLESSVIHSQQTQIFCDSNSSQNIEAQAKLTDTQNALSESNPQQTFSHQKQTSITPSPQTGNSTADNNLAATSCCTTSKLTSGSLSPDVKTSFTTHLSQVHLNRATAGLLGEPQPSNNNMLDNKTLLPSKPFTYTEAADYQDTRDQSDNPGRPDTSNKYQSFFFSGQLHGYPPAECLTSGVRPVQSCQDAAEDTSSSDDEGKLIIEL